MILRRIEPMSFAKISGALYVVLGLFIGLLFAACSMIGSSFASMASQNHMPFIGAIFGFGAIIIFPLFYGAIGFVGALIGATLYNWMARIVGGIQLDIS
jgi:Na+-translocating ferredoxin:NAD+ oxidoreductase RnfA subunit